MRIDLIGKRHPLSNTDFKGESSSDTSQTTSTTDARVGADNGSIVVQSGANYSNNFSPEVAQAVNTLTNKVFDFSAGVVNTAGTILSETLANERQAQSTNLQFAKDSISTVSTVASPASALPLTLSSILTNPSALIAIGLSVGLIVYLTTKKRG